MKHCGFDNNLKKLITILYNDSESCVSNNGYLSPYFKLSLGIRQGCAISSLLFLLVVEVIATILRKSNRVSRLCVSQKQIKLCQLADDMTLFLSSIESVRTVINLFEEFHRY